MDGWNTSFLLGPGLFSGAFAVSFREYKRSFSWDDFSIGLAGWYFLMNQPDLGTYGPILHQDAKIQLLPDFKKKTSSSLGHDLTSNNSAIKIKW